MNCDISQWRARIGCFGNSLMRPNIGTPFFSPQWCSLVCHFLCNWLYICGDTCAVIIANTVLFFIIMSMICLFFIKFPANLSCAKASRNSYRFLPTFIFFMCYDFLLLNCFFSLVNRILLIQSGNVEPHPGPKCSKLSFATWNIDSLLAREGVKKPLLESIQTVHFVHLTFLEYVKPILLIKFPKMTSCWMVSLPARYGLTAKLSVENPMGVCAFISRTIFLLSVEMIWRSLMNA